ncbi:MAG: ABC transporter ATP-binding protein [Clostridium sp.]|nr:ABC transporter ATP-binding protein [Clostridium sp.]
MVNPIVRIANSKTQINTTKDLIDRFPANTESNNYNTELFDRTTNLNNQSNKSELLLKSKITISQLQFNYLNEDVHIIDNLNITFEKGKKYLINGESGTGKSTLAKILARELFPNNGKVYFDNTNIYDINDQLWNSSVRYVDQDSYMFNDTIYENINMYRSLSHEDIQSTLTNLGLQSIELNKLVNDSIGLSGGQKDRVCLARSLCELPEILIVDEPTAALDFNNSIKVFKYLTKLPLTLIVISHESNQEILNLFDQQITLPAIGGEEDA